MHYIYAKSVEVDTMGPLLQHNVWVEMSVSIQRTRIRQENKFLVLN